MMPRALRELGLGAAVLAGTLAMAVPVFGGLASAAPAETASIVGAAWFADNQPIPQAKLRLRNVDSGRIRTHTVANDLGRFAIQGVEEGSYVVELVSEAGRILTVGQSFSVAPGETIATFVRLGTKAPWFEGFFGNAAAAIASSAAAMGVTAVAPDTMTCASAGCL